MASSILLFLLVNGLSFHSSQSASLSLIKGSFLSVENPEDVIISPNGVFSAGFVAVGQNAFSFAISFTQSHSHKHTTIVWMANREYPVNGKGSTLSLLETGNLVLVDAAQQSVWSSNTESHASLELHLKDDGNLVLLELQGAVLWQSFDFPTDTLLPGQRLTRHTQLVSARSETNRSSGFYKLFFDDDNILRLLYDGPDVSSIYWPYPWLVSWDAGRSSYNSSRFAFLDSFGRFISSDNFNFTTSDYGIMKKKQRILKIGSDGNLRVYSLNDDDVPNKWYVSWQLKGDTCYIHGNCGANSMCSSHHSNGRKCSCLPGHRVKNHSDWSYGCEPVFVLTCDRSESTFVEVQGVELYGYDFNYLEPNTSGYCANLCLQDCSCKAFQISYSVDKNYFKCYIKRQLLNGRRRPFFKGNVYLKVPKNHSIFHEESSVVANEHVCSVQIPRVYVGDHVNRFVRVFLWIAIAIGVFEMVCIFVVWIFIARTRQNSSTKQQGYQLATNRFKKFSYSELKKATKGFSQEIGRGAGGVVYKGILSDQRHAAIKRLNEAQQGEVEFLAEVSIIGRLNHMNLIEMWGYCAEGKHRLLVCEYMENGSLADNLSSNNTLDWSKRYDIALGTARGLAYLHDECLEWILHCDIKPQNILLDANYQPKVADFGLSKILNRNNINNSSFSMVRGTRGYMAPEWILNIAITSKVDVYSYGIVLLEMITGKTPTNGVQNINEEDSYNGRLVTWVREKRSSTSWLEDIIDPKIKTNYGECKMDLLAKVALNCVEEDKDARPTMSQVVEMLQSHESDHPW